MCCEGFHPFRVHCWGVGSAGGKLHFILVGGPPRCRSEVWPLADRSMWMCTLGRACTGFYIILETWSQTCQ